MSNIIINGELNADASKWRGTDGKLYQYKIADGQPRIVSQTYLQQIAEGNVEGHTPFTKIGFTPTMTTADSDIWSKAGVYVFPTAAGKWDCISSEAADKGNIIFSGTSSGGSTTSLIDATKDFTAGTPVAVGDCIVLDKSGTTPEWGYVTSVAATTLGVSGGFSSSGTGAIRAYAVLDKSVVAGALAVKIEYLTNTCTSKSEIVILNGAAAVDTINTDLYRVNSFRVIATGTNNFPTGNISLRVSGGATTYSYITAGFTRARNTIYTVPAGKTLYIYEFSAAYATSGSPNKEYARLYTRANMEPSTRFKTGSLFYSYTEVLVQNITIVVPLQVPTKFDSCTDIKMSGIASAAGIATCALRGWLE